MKPQRRIKNYNLIETQNFILITFLTSIILVEKRKTLFSQTHCQVYHHINIYQNPAILIVVLVMFNNKHENAKKNKLFV